MRAFGLAILVMNLSCSSFSKRTAEKGTVFQPVFTPGPIAIVYKTSGDYSDLVSVTLNDSGNRIVAYPAASDVSLMGAEKLRPISLRKKYLLSRGTVTPNSAFLSITWKEYASMQNVTQEKILSLVKHKKPFLEMYNAGLLTDILEMEKAMNRLIKDNQLKKVCKQLI